MLHILLFSYLLSYVNADWKSIFKPQPLHDLSPQCLNDTNTWIQSLDVFATVSEECLTTQKCTPEEVKILEDNLYAVEQLDAFGRFPVPGMLEIATLYDGSNQECQRISGQKYDTNYCYLFLKPGKNATCPPPDDVDYTSMRLAVCFPESCAQQDMTNIFNQMSPYPFTACSAYCVKTKVEKTTAYWGYSIFLIVMASLAVLTSLIDYLRETVQGISSAKETNILMRVLLSFSLWSNAELILSVKEQKPGFIRSLDCIRLFSMVWVVTGHAFMYMSFADTFRPIIDFPNHIWNHFLLNAFVSVDTFFVLSGIVVAYLFFKSKPSRRMISNPITWILFYVHRYLRLTPPMMLFIGFFTVYAPYIQGAFSASQMNPFLPQVEQCKSIWWENLIYINNFDSNNGCYGPTWYLAADTQMYLFAPILLIAFYFSFAAGTALVVLGCVASVITTYILYYKYDITADFFGNGDQDYFFPVIYYKPWIRCPTYLIGILNGYLLARYGNRKVRLNWALSVAGWIVAFVIAAFCLFSTYDYDKGSEWSVFTRATFYNFHRLGWAVFISWVVAANHMGWGGPINNFMSHPIWQPFGRLSYCAYIVHWMVLFYYINLGGHPLHYYSAWDTFIYIALPATFLCYVLAFFWSCIFEISVLKLEKMLIESLIGSSRTSGKVSSTNEKEHEKTRSGNKEVTSWDAEEANKSEYRL